MIIVPNCPYLPGLHINGFRFFWHLVRHEANEADGSYSRPLITQPGQALLYVDYVLTDLGQSRSGTDNVRLALA